MALNNYFCSVFTKETTNNLGKLRDGLLQSRSEQVIQTLAISENDVYEELCKINPHKACGPDDIPGRILKEGAAWIAEPLSKLFTMSLSTGTLPHDWRKANVTPIFKKGSRHSLSNYRPVSLTSLVVKTLERLVHTRVTKFLTSYNKLCPLQHGFRKGHSCQTQLLATMHEWASSLDKRNSTHAIFLDFSKAFDSVPHQRLLLKLENIGVRGSLLDWFKAFLSNRYQRVLVDGHSSDWKPVTSGVPQGSILGPLLFLVYVNEIGDNLFSTTRLFADDCTIYREIKKPSDCELLQADLDSLYNWSQSWQLNLNLSKCKVIRLTNKRKLTEFTYYINNVPLDWVSTFKYLGVKLNTKLSWGDHVTEVTHKASRVLNILRRSLRGCSKDAKAKAYTALVRPHLEYCAPVWSPHQKGVKDELENVQKRAARWICAKWDRSTFCWSKSYEDCRRELKWQTLQQRRHMLSCCQVYKITKQLDCLDFDTYFKYRISVTRSHDGTMVIPSSRINAFRYSFFVNVPFLWNSLPAKVINCPSYSSFKFNCTSLVSAE